MDQLVRLSCDPAHRASVVELLRAASASITNDELARRVRLLAQSLCDHAIAGKPGHCWYCEAAL